jgi:uncharacterized protein YdeI (YjbR/CyaY-like superfamily)
MLAQICPLYRISCIGAIESSGQGAYALAMPKFEPRVDAYIAKSAAFAQPILSHLREMIHAAVPDIEEAIKWSMPFFVHRGVILGNMAAFKAHCSFGIWNENVQEALKATGAEKRGQGMGSFGKIRTMEELPQDRVLKALVQQAAKKIEDGTRTTAWAGRARKEKPETEVPEVLALALKKSKLAGKKFAAMSPSCRREYCEWIGEAKREETRDKRLAQALEWIAEGKTRNWKYQTRP